MLLSEAAAVSGRDNNFNLVRLAAATAVVVSHSFALATGDAGAEPLWSTLGITLGGLAVVAFFMTSGYLVGGSLLSNGQPIRFVVARALRIYPGLWVALLLTVFVLGPAVTGAGIARYLGDAATWRYLGKDAVMFLGVDRQLPRVFDHNPYPAAVNGSLWTLTYELWMYAILLAAWILASGRRRVLLPAIAILAAAGLAAYYRVPDLTPVAWNVAGKASWLAPMFFIGVLVYLGRHRVILSGWLASAAALVLVGAGWLGPAWFKLAYPACLAYVVFFIAYGLPPVRWLLHRDYSYGVYIYSFPLQQLVAFALPGVGVATMFAISMALSLACGALSWHLLESRVLQLVDLVASRVTRMARRPVGEGYS